MLDPRSPHDRGEQVRATTIAATVFVAARAGIRIMATGGLGGVHQGGERSLDVSADLEELARTPITVVCSGVKSILDQARTVERLETLGVPVVGWRCDELPGFYAADTGLRVPRIEQLDDLAACTRRTTRSACAAWWWCSATGAARHGQSAGRAPGRGSAHRGACEADPRRGVHAVHAAHMGERSAGATVRVNARWR